MGFSSTPRRLFENQTVAGLADALIGTGDALSNSDRTENDAYQELPFALANLDEQSIDRLRKQFPDLEDIYPATSLQEGMLFHTVLNPGTGVYLMQSRYVLEGPLDVGLFQRSWQATVDQCAILRTSFL